MNRRELGLLGVFGLGLLACACRSPGPRADLVARRDLLFGPVCVGSAGLDTPRSSWPSTPAYKLTDEHLSYRETIIDRQGRFHFGRDDYYRRFDSVREGRMRR